MNEGKYGIILAVNQSLMGSFCYQPHAAYLLQGKQGEEKRLIIYDNHWSKRRPVKSFDGDDKSYVKIYCWMKGSTEFDKNINMLQKNPLFDPMESG